jgi:ribosomal protein L13E
MSKVRVRWLGVAHRGETGRAQDAPRIHARSHDAEAGLEAGELAAGGLEADVARRHAGLALPRRRRVSHSSNRRRSS